MPQPAPAIDTFPRWGTRWRLKACPRCQGDLYLVNDAPPYFDCLLCGCQVSASSRAIPAKIETRPITGAGSGVGRKPRIIPFDLIYDALKRTESIDQAAAELECSRSYLYRHIKAGGTLPKYVIKGAI